MLSIIITCVNEPAEHVRKTLLAIATTRVGVEYEVIFLDDGSAPEIKAAIKKEVDNFDPRIFRYYAMPTNFGLGRLRDLAVSLASYEACLILDAHMQTPLTPCWGRVVVDDVASNPRTLFCGGCRSIDPDTWLPEQGSSVSFGARFVMADEADSGKYLQATHWLAQQATELADIPSVLGACYWFSKSTYRRMEGLGELIGFGLDEEFLSSKYWLRGGSVKVRKSLVFGHVFDTKKNKVRPSNRFEYYNYNRLLVARLHGEEAVTRMLETVAKISPAAMPVTLALFNNARPLSVPVDSSLVAELYALQARVTPAKSPNSAAKV